MPDFRPLSLATVRVLVSIVNGARYGFDIMDATGLPSGTIYPILARLEQSGLIRGRWESDVAAHREKRPELAATTKCLPPVRKRLRDPPSIIERSVVGSILRLRGRHMIDAGREPGLSPRATRVFDRARRVLALLSIIVPRDRRADWKREWEAEIWHYIASVAAPDRGFGLGPPTFSRLAGALPHAFGYDSTTGELKCCVKT